MLSVGSIYLILILLFACKENDQVVYCIKGRFSILDVDLSDLKLALKLLSGGDIKTLGKMYHINTANQNKVDITDLLMKKTKQNTIGSMFKMAGNTPETVMLNRYM